MLSEEIVAEDGELLGLRVLGAGVEDAVSAGGDDGASIKQELFTEPFVLGDETPTKDPEDGDSPEYDTRLE